MADRTANLPIGKTIRLFNLADGNLMNATGHGLMHSSRNKKEMSNGVKFIIEDRGQGKIALKTADGHSILSRVLEFLLAGHAAHRVSHLEGWVYEDAHTRWLSCLQGMSS